MYGDQEANYKQFQELKERVKQTFDNEFRNSTVKGSNAKHIKAIKKMVENETKKAFETYNQENYVYTYLRSEGGYGNECNILSFPLNYEASVAIGLSLVQMFEKY